MLKKKNKTVDKSYEFKWTDVDNETCDIDLESNNDKPDLDQFFEEDPSLRKQKKTRKQKKQKQQKEERESKKQQAMTSGVGKRKYRLKRKKFKKVEDIIEYINNHYLDSDDIARELLEDKFFYGFLEKKNSRLYEESLAILNVVKEKIEKK
ncbi:MAG: hypothetical protein K9L26_00990 [Candidatus Izimaplasma sp.]|nr:hypothetical protein [Candidatus Izimaplasma bacterium]